MHVKVLFFGVLKEVTGLSRDTLELAENAQLRDAFEHYSIRFPRLQGLAGSIACARNHEFSTPETPLEDGDEIAFMPPVSGGSDLHYFALTRDPIDARDLVRRVQRDSDGAVVTFEGVVRNHTGGRATLYLEYEGYEELALKTMESIGHAIAGAHPVGRIGMVHRLGRLEIGEASVVIVVTSPHRQAAFAAALEGINRLKQQVPIWKKEFFADGEVWVEGAWGADVPATARL